MLNLRRLVTVYAFGQFDRDQQKQLLITSWVYLSSIQMTWKYKEVLKL